MEWGYYRKYIIWKKGMIRGDVTPLFENAKVFHNLIKDLTKPFINKRVDKIAAVDALGFVIGSAMAYRLKKPLILVRKEKKFPYKKNELVSEKFKDYTKTNKSFEIKKNSIKRGDKILLVDEWIQTGAQVKAAISLIERVGGKIIGISTIYIELNNKTKVILKKYNIKPLRMVK